MQLDCDLVDFNVIDHRSGEDASDLDWDGSAEGHALGASEGDTHLVDLLLISDDVLEHSERDLESARGLALDLLSDRHSEDLDGDLEVALLVSESDGATRLPWPEGVVEDLDLGKLGHAWSDLNHILRLALADSTGLLPVLLALEVVPVLAALLELSLPLIWILTEVLHELLHHVTEGRASVTTTATTTTTSAAASTTAAATEATLASELLHHLVEEIHWVLALLLLGLLLIDHSDHDIGGTTRLSDLQEGVLVAETLLTLRAVVKVLADGALVADALDRGDLAAVTGDVLMDSLSLLVVHLRSREIIGRSEQLHEHVLCLLVKLVINKVFKGLARHAFATLATALATAWCTVLHLLIVLHQRGLALGLRRNWGLSTSALDLEDEFHGVALSDGEGQLKIVTILDNDPAVSIVVTQMDTLVNTMFGSEGLGLLHEGIEVRGEHALDHRAFVLGREV